MEYKYKTGLMIGRFQPFHKGHMSILEAALAQCEEVIIAVGSAQESGTFDNPFDLKLRFDIIRAATFDYSHRIRLVGIRDRENPNNDSGWGEYLLRSIFEATALEPEAVFIGKESKADSWFETCDIVVRTISRDIVPISGTQIRQAIAEDDYDTFCDAMPTNIREDMTVDILYELMRKAIANVDNTIYNPTRAKKNYHNIIEFIKTQFFGNDDGKAIIGISGGKDSTITAALCVKALGADRVVGVLMPNGTQCDINDSYRVTSNLGIDSKEINIGEAFRGICARIDVCTSPMSPHAAAIPTIATNLPARLRMAVLYAMAAHYPNSRVVNTCNLSEDYVGYSTKYGDTAGDFSVLGGLTVREVLELGRYMSELGIIPLDLVNKAPADGMCGKTDEDNLGFTYAELDAYLLENVEPEADKLARIKKLHTTTRHKYKPMPVYEPIRRIKK